MAKQAKPKTDGASSKGVNKTARRTPACQARHDRRKARQEARAARPDSAVSANCLKKRAERRRLKSFLASLPTGRSKSDREEREVLLIAESPSVKGERQFGARAKGWHIHQRDNRLPRALTKKEFAKVEEQRRLEAARQQMLKEAIPVE